MDPPTSGTPAAPSAPRPVLSPASGATPHDRCFRCGKPIPIGSSLCADHNPGRIRGPSSTQMHATILVGVLAGFLGFLVLGRLLVSPAGPWSVEVLGRAPDGAGGVLFGLRVVNQGDAAGVATCRVTRDGVPRPDDLTFRTSRIEGGAAVVLERTVEPGAGGAVPYDPERAGVTCS